MMRVVALISGRGTNMLALDESIARKELPAKIVGVIAGNNKATGLEEAKKRGLPTIRVPRSHFGSQEEFEENLRDAIESFMPDLVVLAGFLRVLSAKFVTPYAGRMINIHPSLLPAYPGLDTHNRVIAAREPRHGVTVHYVIPKLDAGPIIVQKAIKTSPEENSDALAARLLPDEHKSLIFAVRLIAEGRIRMHGENVLYDEKPLPAQGVFFDIHQTPS